MRLAFPVSDGLYDGIRDVICGSCSSGSNSKAVCSVTIAFCMVLEQAFHGSVERLCGQEEFVRVAEKREGRATLGFLAAIYLRQALH